MKPGFIRKTCAFSLALLLACQPVSAAVVRAGGVGGRSASAAGAGAALGGTALRGAGLPLPDAAGLGIALPAAAIPAVSETHPLVFPKAQERTISAEAAANGPAPKPAREDLAGLTKRIASDRPEAGRRLDSFYSGARAFSAEVPAPDAGGTPGRETIGRAPRTEAGALRRVESNPALRGVSGSFRVDVSRSGRSDKLTAPQAAALSAAVARAMPAGTLDDASVTEIVLISKFADVRELEASPSGRVLRRISKYIVVDEEPGTGFRRVYLRRSALADDLSPVQDFRGTGFSALYGEAPGKPRSIPRLDRRKIGPLIARPRGSIFVGGLISISAEPPEGFFAASTLSEFQRRGWRPSPADKAGVWVYRVPDSRESSYFDFTFASPDRPADGPRNGKFKVAAGIGPAKNPASPGGAEADLLWLGDEQHGALEEHLALVGRTNLALEDLYGRSGFVQKISETEVVVGGIDKAHSLTPRGFDALETDPSLYRRVFSEEYDAYLLGLFEHDARAARSKSYLLATSRGCSQGCAICCSGGLSRFQYFSAERMMRELEKIESHARVAPGEKINVFFVDSNFNNNPNRIIEFAELLSDSPMKDRFRFFIRHNTVNGFLKPEKEGEKTPNHELIRAYAALGIREVFMGVDAYDDAGVRTLKTNRNLLAKKAGRARPTYSYKEFRELVRAFEGHGLSARGFFLTNNPWVSDLDRIDSYYNLIELWLENPHFSIDARERDILRLKPFAGSPITDAAEGMKRPPLSGGRFTARTVLGELDEMMEFSELGRTASSGGRETALEQFRLGVARVRSAALRAAHSGAKEEEREAGRSAIRKLLARDAELAGLLSELPAGPAAARLAADMADFAEGSGAYGAFDPREQERAFDAASASLIKGLRDLAGYPRLSSAAGYSAEAAALDPLAPHTIKDVPGYLKDNLGAEALRAAGEGRARFLIVVGDGRAAGEQAKEAGWTLHERLEKTQGFHQVFRALDPDGRRAYLILRVNGEDRVTHVQTLLKMAGLPENRLETIGRSVSWKAGYLETFRTLGHVPDAVLYGFANTAADSILLRNKLANAKHLVQMALNYDRKHSKPKIGAHDLDGLDMQVVEFENGKRLWLFNCMYGDLSKDLFSALIEHGADNITFMGTAGSLTSKHKVRDMVTPAYKAGPGREPLAGISAAQGVRRAGGYVRVATPNLETKGWVEDAVAAGAELVEVELEHVLEETAKHPEITFRAVLVVSDVIAGPEIKDMTEWGLWDLRALMPKIGTVLDGMLGMTGDRPYRVKSYRHVPLVSDGE